MERDNSATREFQSAFSQFNFTWEVRHIDYNLYTTVYLEQKGREDFVFLSLWHITLMNKNTQRHFGTYYLFNNLQIKIEKKNREAWLFLV